MSELNYDYQRYAVLFVDDEEKTRKYFRRLYGETFRILEASDGVEALSVFRAHAAEIGIIVTDQRMPNETGVGFLAKISDQYPDVVKILSTAYSDLDAAIGSGSNEELVEYLGARARTRVGGGIRSAEKARRLIDLGAAGGQRLAAEA